MKSVANTLKIVELIAELQPVSLIELEKHIDIPKTTIQRALTTLQKNHWIRPQSPIGKPKWMLSAHILRLSNQNPNLEKLIETCRPYLQRLRDLSGETVFLSSFEVDGMIVIDYLDSQNIIKASLATGTHAPLVSTSTGKATLAALTIEERKKLLANYYPDFLDSKGNPKSSLENELKIISKQKYAVSEGEWIPEIGNLGIALINSVGAPIGGIGITVPMTRWKSLKIGVLARALVKTKNEIEASL